MNDRDWAFLTDPDYGSHTRDVEDWMLRPYSEKDKEKHREKEDERGRDNEFHIQTV